MAHPGGSLAGNDSSDDSSTGSSATLSFPGARCLVKDIRAPSGGAPAPTPSPHDARRDGEDSNDSQAQVRGLSPLCAQEERQDRQAQESGHVPLAGRGQEAREG